MQFQVHAGTATITCPLYDDNVAVHHYTTCIITVVEIFNVDYDNYELKCKPLAQYIHVVSNNMQSSNLGRSVNMSIHSSWFKGD